MNPQPLVVVEPKLSAKFAALKTFLVFGVIAVICLNPASAAKPAIVAKASASTVRVAEPFTIQWSVSAAEGARVAFPAVGKQFGDFDVIETRDLFDIPDADSTKKRTWTRRMTLESIVTGKRDIPEQDVQVNDVSGSAVIRSNPITINVASVLEDRSDPTKFRDIQSVVNVDLPQTPSAALSWWTWGGVAGLTLLAIAAMVVSRRGNWVTPKDWALEELEELETSSEAGTLTSETSALKLSEIVKSFLLLQLGIPESGHTPHELVQQIVSSKRVGGDVTNRLNELFTLADKAKFAGLELSATGLKSAIRDTRDLVQKIANESNSNPTAL